MKNFKLKEDNEKFYQQVFDDFILKEQRVDCNVLQFFCVNNADIRL